MVARFHVFGKEKLIDTSSQTNQDTGSAER